MLDESPRRSIRNIAIAKKTKLSTTSVRRILRKELSKYPYRIQMMQEQTVDNKEQRTDFAKTFASKMEGDRGFFKNLIASDDLNPADFFSLRILKRKGLF